jgi:diguanylate cyclase (GGDEF)-like protein/PAS domain S-box-containing protein
MDLPLVKPIVDRQFLVALLDEVSSHIAVAIVDAAGRIVCTNARWNELASADGSEQEWIGADCLEAIGSTLALPGRMARTLRESILSVMRGERDGIRHECPVDGPDGQRWFELRMRQIAGAQPMLFAVVFDTRSMAPVTGEAEERLKVATDAARIGIWDLDLPTSRLAWNEWMYQLYGVDPPDFPGTYDAWEQAVHPEDRAAVAHAVRQALDARCPFDTRFRILRGDGEVRFVESRATILFRDGSPVRIIGVNLDVTEQRAAESRIEQLAQYDQLTGLPNRRLLLDRVAQALAHGRRTGEYGALMFVDLDHFKWINDTAGHAAGDEILRQVARRLAAVLREEDTVGRLGGDEFVVLLQDLGAAPGLAAAYARNVAGKLAAALRKPFRVDGVPYRTSGSVGIAMCSPSETDAAQLLRRADLAMYKSKERGRDSVRFFDPRLQQEVDARAALESELRRALDHGELEVHYQPVCDASGNVLAAEALVRWQHPQRGLLLPAAFLPVAEKCGLMAEIGTLVLGQVCGQLMQWADRGATRDLGVSVNISASQLSRQRFARDLVDLVVEAGVQPSKLTLEFTESAIVDQGERARRQIGTLREAGFRLSLDNFGTGYSSLTYLKGMRFDEVKVDRSFVRDLMHDAASAAIVEALLSIARVMGLDVVAEGVETPAQLTRLEVLGCRRFQGFLMARPLAAAAFTAVAALGAVDRA